MRAITAWSRWSVAKAERRFGGVRPSIPRLLVYVVIVVLSPTLAIIGGVGYLFYIAVASLPVHVQHIIGQVIEYTILSGVVVSYGLGFARRERAAYRFNSSISVVCRRCGIGERVVRIMDYSYIGNLFTCPVCGFEVHESQLPGYANTFTADLEERMRNTMANLHQHP